MSLHKFLTNITVKVGGSDLPGNFSGSQGPPVMWLCQRSPLLLVQRLQGTEHRVNRIHK